MPIDDMDDEGQQQPQQPDWTAVATAMPTWNQGDEIDLQRLTNGASYARNQRMSGRWGPETYDAITGQLNEQLGPMMQRKQQAVQLQQQQAVQQALHQNAIASGIRQSDLQTAARAFPSTVQELYNPNTGGIDRYVPDGKGGWQIQPADPVQSPTPGAGTGEGGESDRPVGGGGAEGSGPGDTTPPGTGVAAPLAPDGQPYGDQPRFRTVVGPDGVQRQQRIPTRGEFEAMQTATPEEQVGIADRIGRGTFDAANPTGGGGLTASIENGPYREVFDQGRLTQTNRPPYESQGGPQGTSAQDFHKQALSVVGPPPAQFYRGAHGQMLPNPQYSRWLADVRSTAAELHKEHRQTKALEARDSLEHQREQHREQMQTQRQQHADQQKQQGEKASAWDSMYKSHLTELQKEWDFIRQHDKSRASGEKVPPEFKDRASMEAEAEKRADADFQRGHGHLPESRQQVEEARRRQQAAAGPQPVPKEVTDRLNRLKDADAKTHKDVQERQRVKPLIQSGPGQGGFSPLELFR